MAADTYRTLVSDYPHARWLGLTATPQRADGKPLGELFDALIVGARYPALVAAGHLVQCRVFRPDQFLAADLAQEPLAAWRQLAALGIDGPTFAFARSISEAKAQANAFAEAGVPSDYVTGQCGDRRRAETLARFRAGQVQVLWNVFVLTEGIDVPDASVCLLARGCGAAATYLQMVGRVLRPAPGKTAAVLLDLPGVSHVHGLPLADRDYSLDGRPIRVVGESLKNCPQCGACVPAAENPCECCGYLWPAPTRLRPKIWNLALAEAIDAAGGDVAAVGDEWREREARRLLRLARDKGWSVEWPIREWRKLFEGDPFPRELLCDSDVAAIRATLTGVARRHGYRHGWVVHRMKALLG